MVTTFRIGTKTWSKDMTRIFIAGVLGLLILCNHNLNMRSGPEDGLAIALLPNEASQNMRQGYIPTDSMPVTVTPLDLTRRLGAYDDREPEDWNALVQFPMGKPEWAFSLAEAQAKPFANLLNLLGKKGFDAIMAKQGYSYPKGEFATYTGEDRLPLYYYTRDDKEANAHILILVSCGEYQPARIIANIEGVWRVSGVKF